MLISSSRLPLVSVAIPTYNQEAFLAETLESILTQDYPNLQIIISDDASVDGTRRIVEEFRDRYPERIAVQTHNENRGATANAQSMLAAIKGEYVCWFAGDDIMLPGKVSAQVAQLEKHPEAVMSYHDVVVVSDEGDLYTYNEEGPGQKPFAGRIVEELIKFRCFVPCCSAMCRVSATVGLSQRAEIERASDWLYMIELAERGPVVYIDRSLAKYRRHANNLSRVVDVRDEERVYEIVEALYPKYIDAIEYGRARLYIAYLFKYAINRNWSASRRMAAALLLRGVAEPRGVPQMVAALVELVVQRLHVFRRTGQLAR
jgi:glycosyltransferase involved in cell wall biosynthesis